ncbi:hypothetical protein ABW19_dt0202187 [Dactylella cylindrospora]|nr:hypothetical protein ABW19_dt0202187 [Dactylella cylindrospora]
MHARCNDHLKVLEGREKKEYPKKARIRDRTPTRSHGISPPIGVFRARQGDWLFPRACSQSTYLSDCPFFSFGSSLCFLRRRRKRFKEAARSLQLANFEPFLNLFQLAKL